MREDTYRRIGTLTALISIGVGTSIMGGMGMGLLTFGALYAIYINYIE